MEGEKNEDSSSAQLVLPPYQKAQSAVEQTMISGIFAKFDANENKPCPSFPL